jgi:Flp pilus assembly protein TadG
MKALKGNSGQALIETAIILPVVMLLVLNVVNFGFFFCRRFKSGSLAEERRRVFHPGFPDSSVTGVAGGWAPEYNDHRQLSEPAGSHGSDLQSDERFYSGLLLDYRNDPDSESHHR